MAGQPAWRPIRDAAGDQPSDPDRGQVLPGGYGTFDEFFEVVSWTQLGVHNKPCGVLDVAGFFAPLRAMLDVATRHGFISAVHRDLVITDDEPTRLLDRLAAWTPVTNDKWLDKSER